MGNELQDVIGRALDAIRYEIQNEDDLDLLDLASAESELCSWNGLKEEDAFKTDGLSSALALIARTINRNLEPLIFAALTLEELQRLCSYDRTPSTEEIKGAENARQELCSGLEELVEGEGT